MDNKFVRKIFELSELSFKNDEVPVGAIVVRNGLIIGVGTNTREKEKSVIGHAEINAIENACANIGDWRLDECEMYVTLYPCLMCAGAIIESRLKKVYYLCDKTNVCIEHNCLRNISKIDNDEFEKKYLNLLRLFFENKRN